MFPDTPFTANDWSHGLAVLVIAVIGSVLLRRVVRVKSDNDHRKLRRVLAYLLFYSALAGMVNAYLRLGGDSFDRIHATEYPLFLCDVVSIVLGVALITKSQRLTEVGYAWGIAGTVQGLITPVTRYDFPAPEYFSFFLQHGGVPIAAILLIWGFGLRPQKGAYLRIWLWTWGYLAITMTLNWLLGTNYSFLNAKPPVPTALDVLGPHPWYLLSLHALAALIFWALLLPFRDDEDSAKNSL